METDSSEPVRRSEPRTLTRLMSAWESGDPRASEALWQEVLPEVRRIAGRRLRASSGAQSLAVTEVVSELFLRLEGGERAKSFPSRGHFLAFTAQVVRNLLVDRARSRSRRPLVSAEEDVGLDAAVDSYAERARDLVELDEELQRLAEQDERAARVVELRFFGGLQWDEIASVLGISESSVHRLWRPARAFLGARLR